MDWFTVGEPWALDFREDKDSSTTSCWMVKLSSPELSRLISFL